MYEESRFLGKILGSEIFEPIKIIPTDAVIILLINKNSPNSSKPNFLAMIPVTKKMLKTIVRPLKNVTMKSFLILNFFLNNFF